MAHCLQEGLSCPSIFKIMSENLNTKKRNLKRNALTGEQKKKLCLKKQMNPKTTGIELAREFNIGERTVSSILREKDKWLSIDSDMPKLSLKKQRPPAWPQLEESLSIWMDQAIRYDSTLSGHIMKEKAKRFAELLQINKFTASSGWFDGFKKRYNVREYLRAGEGNSAPLENLPEFRSQLQDIIKNYELRNVFNCDETALFWLLEPNRTLSKGVVVGTKNRKNA